jgi:O-antigen/teichoic acid export membrane protein
MPEAPPDDGSYHLFTLLSAASLAYGLLVIRVRIFKTGTFKGRISEERISEGSLSEEHVDTPTERISKGAIWNALGSTMFAANTLVMVVVVSRTASVATVGCFGIALAISQLLFNIGIFGVDLFQMTDYQRQYRFADYLWTRVLTCALMLLVCLAIVVWGIAEPEKKLLVALLTVTFLAHALADLYQGLFFRENRLDLSGQALFFRVFIALVAFVLIQALTRNVALALVASIAANIIGIGIWGTYRAKSYHEGHRGIRPERIVSILRSCLPLFISSFLVLFIFNAPRYGIEWFMDDTAQGYFSMIVLPALLINLTGQFIFRPALNGISRAFKFSDTRAFFRILARNALIVLALTAAATLAMPFIGIPLLTMLYAVDLSALALEASLLLIGGGLFAVNQLAYSVLVVMREQTKVLLVYAAGLILGLIVTIVAILNLGLLGASLAFVLVQIPILLLFAFVLLRTLASR